MEDFLYHLYFDVYMKIAIISSSKDPAGINTRNNLIELFDFKKLNEKFDFILLDWKGLGKEKQRIINLLKNLNLEFRRTDKILKD